MRIECRLVVLVGLDELFGLQSLQPLMTQCLTRLLGSFLGMATWKAMEDVRCQRELELAGPVTEKLHNKKTTPTWSHGTWCLRGDPSRRLGRRGQYCWLHRGNSRGSCSCPSVNENAVKRPRIYFCES